MTDALSEVDQHIAAAMAALHGARAASNLVPSGDNILTEQLCEQTLDDLLDLRCAMTRERVTA